MCFTYSRRTNAKYIFCFLHEAEICAPTALSVIDGSYSHHPILAENYDLKIFLTCGKEEQARRLRIRVNGKDGRKYLAHTLNNTVVAPPRMLIAFLENNMEADGSVKIPVALRPYMGGKEVLLPKA